jgi:serine protease Do
MYENIDWKENDPYYPKKPNSTRIIILCIVCSILAGALGAGCVYFYSSTPPSVSSQITKSSRSSPAPSPVSAGKVMTPAQVYAQNVNSTVGITTAVSINYWGYPSTAAASGSGFILTQNGYVLTNYHVVEGSDSISVSCYDGTTYQARLVSSDPSKDVAILKIEAEDLTPVVFGNSADLCVGDPVVAIGNPLGELTFSLTSGAVSAKDRSVTLQSGITMNLLQTDCAINSGNSGGALFNLYGEVIGITNAKYSASGSGASIDNIGFAIPINDVEAMITSVIQDGYYAKPYIGIQVSDVSQESQSYGLPAGSAVRFVEEDSPAQKAGLQINDIITHLNGEKLTDSNQLVTALGRLKQGNTVTLGVYRSGATFELTITVGSQIQSTGLIN